MIVSVLGAIAARAQTAVPDTTAVPDPTLTAPLDSSRAAVPDTLHTITVEDSLGIPGTLKGQTDPAHVKEVLQHMGSSEGQGRTEWERKKNPRTAMLCSMVLPGLGQTYNGRRLKVGLMVGFASYYMGNTWLNYKRWTAAEQTRDLQPVGSPKYLFEDDLASFYEEEARTYLWWSGAVWLLGLIDSWIDAHLYDVRSYTPPAPPQSDMPRAVNERTSYLTFGFGLEFSK